MNLNLINVGQDYTIKSVNTHDAELNSFLFSLGCYSGEPITLIKRSRSGCIIAIKDGRYSIDSQLANVIEVE